MLKKIINNIKDSYKHIPYTWKHYLSFLKVEKAILGYYKYKFHDWDKLFMYIFFPYLGTKLISRIHQQYQRHHDKYETSNFVIIKHIDDVNFEEAILDWECARYTKPDKPLDAYDTYLERGYNNCNCYPSAETYIKPIMKKMGLWRGEEYD